MLPAYQELFDTMIVQSSKLAEVDFWVQKILSNQNHYQNVAQVTRVPWTAIAVIHYRECNLSFTHHLHNGDPLSGRTVHVPAGRPVDGYPPFTWEESAVDALHYEGFTRITDWSIPSLLFHLEAYNGMGYHRRGLLSPYLWSFSNHYTKGKYTSDHGFDPQAIDSQCGCVPILAKIL